MLVPLDRGPCVSSRRFAYFFLKCAPLPHKTITAQSETFVVVPFSETPIEDSAFSPFAPLPLFYRRPQTSDPCRGFAPPPSSPDSLLLSSRPPICDPCRGFGSSDRKPVSTAPRRSQDAPGTPLDAPKTPPGRPAQPPPLAQRFLETRAESGRPSGRHASTDPPFPPA